MYSDERYSPREQVLVDQFYHPMNRDAIKSALRDATGEPVDELLLTDQMELTLRPVMASQQMSDVTVMNSVVVSKYLAKRRVQVDRQERFVSRIPLNGVPRTFLSRPSMS
jgi:hypothetical protein